MSLPKATSFEPPSRSRTAHNSPRRSVKESFSEGGSGPKVKATFEFDKDLHQRLKVAAVAEGRTMREIVEELVGDYLEAR